MWAWYSDRCLNNFGRRRSGGSRSGFRFRFDFRTGNGSGRGRRRWWGYLSSASHSLVQISDWTADFNDVSICRCSNSLNGSSSSSLLQVLSVSGRIRLRFASRGRISVSGGIGGFNSYNRGNMRWRGRFGRRRGSWGRGHWWPRNALTAGWGRWDWAGCDWATPTAVDGRGGGGWKFVTGRRGSTTFVLVGFITLIFIGSGGFQSFSIIFTPIMKKKRFIESNNKWFNNVVGVACADYYSSATHFPLRFFKTFRKKTKSKKSESNKKHVLLFQMQTWPF